MDVREPAREISSSVDTAEDLNPYRIAQQQFDEAWAATPIKERVQVFFRYKGLLEKKHRRAGEARDRGERED